MFDTFRLDQDAKTADAPPLTMDASTIKVQDTLRWGDWKAFMKCPCRQKTKRSSQKEKTINYKLGTTV